MSSTCHRGFLNRRGTDRSSFCHDFATAMTTVRWETQNMLLWERRRESLDRRATCETIQETVRNLPRRGSRFPATERKGRRAKQEPHGAEGWPVAELGTITYILRSSYFIKLQWISSTAVCPFTRTSPVPPWRSRAVPRNPRALGCAPRATLGCLQLKCPQLVRTGILIDNCFNVYLLTEPYTEHRLC